MRSIELRRREKEKKSAKRAACKARDKYVQQQFEFQRNRIGRSMEEALAEGIRIHEKLEEEQRFRDAIAASRKSMGSGSLPVGIFQRLPISTTNARELVYRWRVMFPAVDDFLGKVDYASVEARTLAALPEGVSVYGVPQTEQEKATEAQARQGFGQALQTQAKEAQSRR